MARNALDAPAVPDAAVNALVVQARMISKVNNKKSTLKVQVRKCGFCYLLFTYMTFKCLERFVRDMMLYLTCISCGNVGTDTETDKKVR